jgi:hypothetical protein
MFNAPPFPTIVYQPNPAFFQIGQAALVSPIPGTSASAYAIASGTLPAGLSLNAVTGVISGTPSMLSPASTVTIAGTMPNSSIFDVKVTITITNIPLTAISSNQSSATGLNSVMNFYETNFISQCNEMILNNNSLGKFSIDADVPPQASMKTLRAYFTSLNYNFWPIYWRANNANNDYYNPFGDFSNPEGYPYSLPRVGYAVKSARSNRVRISWASNTYSTQGSPWLPFYPWP